MNSQIPPSDDEPSGPLPGPESQPPTEPLPPSAQLPSPGPEHPAPGPGAAPGGQEAGPGPNYGFQDGPAPAASTDFFGWVRSQGIHRGNDRWIGGVCSGIAHRLNVDPIIIRGAAIVLTLLAGIGVLVYGLAWALLPEPDGRIHVQEAGAGRWSSGMTGALIATVLGLTGLGGGYWGWSHNGLSGLLWTVFWVGGAIYLIYYLTQRNKAHPTMAGHSVPPRTTYPAGRPGTGAASAFSTGTASAPAPGHPATPQYGPPTIGAGTDGGYGPPTGAGPGRPGPSAAGPAGAGNGTGFGGPGSAATGGGSYPAPWVPPRPSKPRPAGPGAPAVAIATGAALVVGGGLKALDAANIINLGGSANAIVWASAAAVLGLGILVAGFRGRTAGILSLFAVIALVTGGIYNTLDDGRMRFQQVDWSPAGIEEARGGIDITAGRGTVNLTDLSPSTPLTSDVVVPLDITASNVTVVIPRNLPVDIKADMTMGNLNEPSGQRGGTTTRESTYNTDKPGNHLVVQIDGTFSNVTIQEGN
ncbi:PspC domain-containing protein [Pseudarthrobacter enclensis]|uniref:Phage shock protein PspC (Stress-responsive transcriptional regulator) n=1 Tax=Pseudarthrobacter enclensis TaxID=993070 RepID=A0ABT9RPM1_9MICC|nr:PspC domain-containing protein [Pseudarthrobacter enclensis]MDP9887180.1 phage shock protein PspC (stress-responsive transcriptional regulator) [Pseudarthrobacter enclensis]